MGKRISGLIIAVLCFVMLTGCLFQSVSELYSLPKKTAGYEQLLQAIDVERRKLETQYNSNVDYAAIYSGDNTANIQFQDLDGDGVRETAVTFFRVPAADMPLRICFFNADEEGNYSVRAVIEGEGAAIYSIDYAKLNQDGPKEVVVSWQISSGVNRLAVYTLDDGAASRLMSTTYHDFRVLDLDQDGLMEVAVIRLDTAGVNSSVEVCGWEENSFIGTGTVGLSAGISSLTRVRANYLLGSVPALYITSTLTDGSYATDLVAYRNGTLTNLTMDPNTGISRESIRDYGDIAASDVNGDGILELPRPSPLPSYGKTTSSNFWLLDWVQYDTQGTAHPVCTTYHNMSDEWYFVIPEGWKDRITIYRDDSTSGMRAVYFALWNGSNVEPEPFLVIYKLTGINRNTQAQLGSRFILAENNSTIYAAEFYSSWDCGLDEVSILDHFRLLYN